MTPRALLVMAPETFTRQFGPTERARLQELVTLVDPSVAEDFTSPPAEVLAEVEVLITSWGAPELSIEALQRMPALRVILHAAGSVRGILPAGVFALANQRGIRVTSAAEINAIPVAEFTLAAIIFAGKRALPLAQASRTAPVGWEEAFATRNLSNLDRTIGLVGFSKIGRRVLDLLPALQTKQVLVADPFADADQVAAAGGTLAPLAEVLAHSEILSLHAPLLPATHRMIGQRELATMPDGATLINTARGGLVDHDALTSECASGRIDAILDVTDPEPLPAGHPLLTLDNVTVTPHVAGSLGSEVRRMTWFVLDALAAYCAGADLPGLVPADATDKSA